MELCHDDRRPVHDSQRRSVAESRRAKRRLAERASKYQQGCQELLKYRAVSVEGARFRPHHRIEFHQQCWGSFEANQWNRQLPCSIPITSLDKRSYVAGQLQTFSHCTNYRRLT